MKRIVSIAISICLLLTCNVTIADMYDAVNSSFIVEQKSSMPGEKEENASWLCPSCGRLNFHLFCPDCGTGKPDQSQTAGLQKKPNIEWGSWRLTHVLANDRYYSADEINISTYLDLWEDGTCLLSQNQAGEIQQVLGTWLATDNEVTIWGEGFYYTIRIQNDEMIWQNGHTLYLSCTDTDADEIQHKKMGQVSRLKAFIYNNLNELITFPDTIGAYYYENTDVDKLIDSAIKELCSIHSLSEADLSETKFNKEAEAEFISKDIYYEHQKFNELVDTMAIIKYRNSNAETDTLVYEACEGLMAGLNDDHSYFYKPDKWAQLWENKSAGDAGIGIYMNLDKENNACVISRVIKDGPAAKSGIRRGDILLRVGKDFFVTPETFNSAPTVLCGEIGTTVDVTIRRADEVKTIRMIRDTIEMKTVDGTMISDKVGFISIYELSGNSDEALKEELEKLIKSGAEKIIIDLRDNQGGWLDIAQKIADLFMDKGDLGYLQYRDGEKNYAYPTEDGKYEVSLLVLVNEYTASGAEFLAETLKESASAQIIGVPTAGECTVQAVLPFDKDIKSGYQITIAQFYSPDGRNMKNGVALDYELKESEDEVKYYEYGDVENDTYLIKALEII